MVFVSLLTLAPLNPRPEVPTVGAQVDQMFEIDLATSVEGPVVLIAARGAKIVIARVLLEQLAALDGPRWRTEQERTTQIAAGRAKKLLDRAGTTSAELGEPLRADAIGDADYLVAQILEAGKALVFPEGSRDPVAKISVRYSGIHPGPNVGSGRIFFSLLTRPPVEFFSVSWFSS